MLEEKLTICEAFKASLFVEKKLRNLRELCPKESARINAHISALEATTELLANMFRERCDN